MATKTIPLEIDAYERLKRAKRTPRESFSEVVRRLPMPAGAITDRHHIRMPRIAEMRPMPPAPRE